MRIGFNVKLMIIVLVRLLRLLFTVEKPCRKNYQKSSETIDDIFNVSTRFGQYRFLLFCCLENYFH